MQADVAWKAVLGQLEMEFHKATYDTWIRDTKFIAFEDNAFVIGTKNSFARDWLESRLTGNVTKKLSELMKDSVEVRFVFWMEAKQFVAPAPRPTREAAPTTSIAPPTQSTNENRTMGRYSFANFVVGPSNRLAHAAAMAVADNPSFSYNPLFIYGGVGLGKTHLLHAIGNECEAKGLNVLYVSSEEFTNDLIQSIRSQKTQAFREKYRECDVLLIDDIQFIAGKESTQEEFFHTFNTLHGQNKQIVIAADRSPKAMSTLEDRLRSRFEGGLIADIQSPDMETRFAILQEKMAMAHRTVSDEVLRTIAKHLNSNIRELEGALNRVMAYADLRGVEPNEEIIQIALADMIPQRQVLDKDAIIETVATSFGVTTADLKSKRRTKVIAETRQIAMYFLREEAELSLPQIGQKLGNRDHSTISYGYEKVAERMEHDQHFRREMMELRDKIYQNSGS